MPRTSCGAPMAFGCSGGRRLGLDLHRRRHWNAECVLACLQARRPLRRPAADLHGACRAVWLDRGRRGSGAGLADGSRLPVSVGPLHQPDQVLGHPAVLRVAEPQTNGVAERFNRTLKEQIIHGRIYRHRSCGTPSATSSNSTMPSGSSKRTALAQASGRGTPRSQSGPPRGQTLPRNRVRYTI